MFAGRMLLCGLSIFVFATSPASASNAVCAFRDIGFPGELIAASLTDGDCGGDDGTFVDIYRFSIFNENDLLDVTVTSSSFQPTFKVYRVENFSEPIILSSDTDGRAEFSIRNLFSGQYLLVVSSRL